MREFFRECLKSLYVYCGNRQIDKMSDEEIKTLLDALERMSKLYGYIPEERQKEIITNCLLTDKDYQNINVRTVAKWLELNGKQYFKEEAHQTIESTSEPLTGEARAEWLAKWQKSLNDLADNFNATEPKVGSGSRLKESMGAAGQGKAWKEYVIDGVGIYAPSEAEARAMRNQIS